MTISANTVWEGKYYFGPGVIVTIDAVIFDLTNVDIVFDECAGIDFINGAFLRANNSVFRPCELNKSWRGFDFSTNSQGIIDECTFKNAQKALRFTGSGGTIADARIQNNLFSNCHRAILIENDDFGEAITGNTFVIEDTEIEWDNAPCSDIAFNNEYWGIFATNSDFGGLVSQNDFINSFENNTSRRYYGFYGSRCTNGTISKNNFSEMYRSIDLATCANFTIENNEIEITRDFNPTFHQVRLTTVCRHIWVSGNEIKNSNDYGTNTLTNSAIYIERCKRITVNENHIEGLETGIQAKWPINCYIGDNEIVNSQFYGIYVTSPYIVDIACNRINMDLDANGSVVGIAVLQNGLLDRLVKIRTNCISECTHAIYLESFTSGAPIPSIKNNFLYNYSAFGVLNLGYSGDIGNSISPFSNAGRNTFVSNNIPNGAVDIWSNNPMIAAGNYGVSTVSAGVTTIGTGLYNSTASCGVQIGTVSSEIGDDEICENFKENVINIVRNDGSAFRLQSDYMELLDEIDADMKFEFILNALYLLAQNDDFMEMDRLYDEITDAGMLFQNEALWLGYYYHFNHGDYSVASNILDNMESTSIDEFELIQIEKIASSLKVNDRIVADMSAAEIETLIAIDARQGENADLARDLLQVALGNFDYLFEPVVEPKKVETNTVSLLADFLEIYPNPTSGDLFVEYFIDDISKANVQLFDIKGSLLSEVAISYDNDLIRLDLSDLPGGMYVLTINSEDGFLQRAKVMKH
jgi:hypothetical protein